jgi:hypothetical protein
MTSLAKGFRTRRLSFSQPVRVATDVATPADVCGGRNTIQHVEPVASNMRHHRRDVGGGIETKLDRTSKPLVGILGDVDGQIVPVAPPPALNLGVTAEPASVTHWKTVLAKSGPHSKL